MRNFRSLHLSLRGVARLAVVAVVLDGCAKYPSTSTGTGTKRLTFSLTVAGQIRSDYVYIVALQPSNLLNPTTTGPVPVITPPWGNGFVAGNCTYFVRWDPTQQPAYQIYQFTDPTLQNYFQIGVPISYVDVSANGRTLQFDLDMSQIASSPDAANAYQSLQVNFLTMDRVPKGVSGSKNWDALGDGRTPGGINQYITIPLTTTGTYDNNFYQGLEPQGDVISDGDPDLDITDFSVTVRQP